MPRPEHHRRMSGSSASAAPPDLTCYGSTRPGLEWVWRHSSYSQGTDSTCVDVALTATVVAVRDSKDPTGPILEFSTREWQVFLLAARAGEFDLPSPPCRSDSSQPRRA